MSMNTVSVDRKFLEHCLSVMRGVGELCQPIPRKSEDDPTEYCGGQALAELANCHNRLQETIAYAEQVEQPAEQEFHRVFEANESLEESLAEQPEAGRDEAVVDEADWTDRELKLIRFAVHRFMNDAYAKAGYAAQRGTADQVRAFHADAKDAEAVLAKLRTLAPPVSAEAGRDEAVAVVHDDDSGGHWVELTDDVKDGDLLYLHPPANAEAVRLVAAFRGFWVTNESGMLERCVATIDAIEKACRDADAFLAAAQEGW